MLWSDRDEQPEEIQRAQAMLRRAGFMIAVVLPLIMAIAFCRG
ncbi:morphogenic membrane protein MmpB [Streptantibioticus ferralitis]|uniref:Uncharacterized protein n=1 Tax=Streptantibioticus ferralitis TaxID=236510 RepID=A0ABT5Z1V3_9ACTN|nr:hypothetical protein [Streptantibioticus ferralitis]MDF2257826.1 hypothetical protein [Streptantibioticus ferralitis]